MSPSIFRAHIIQMCFVDECFDPQLGFQAVFQKNMAFYNLTVNIIILFTYGKSFHSSQYIKHLNFLVKLIIATYKVPTHL